MQNVLLWVIYLKKLDVLKEDEGFAYFFSLTDFIFFVSESDVSLLCVCKMNHLSCKWRTSLFKHVIVNNFC